MTYNMTTDGTIWWTWPTHDGTSGVCGYIAYRPDHRLAAQEAIRKARSPGPWHSFPLRGESAAGKGVDDGR